MNNTRNAFSIKTPKDKLIQITMSKAYKMYINGKWVNAKSKKRTNIVNPATEKVIATVPEGGREDARAAIDAARDAFDSGKWSLMSPGERAGYLWKLADMLEKQTARFAYLESANQGKTIRYARENDLPFIIDNLRFFAGAARNLEGRAANEYIDHHTHRKHEGMGTSLIRREPIGVVAAIVPWNYPLYIACWKIGPALATGNTLVIKPASLTPLTLLEFAKLADRLLPKGVFNVVTGPGETVGNELAINEHVDMVTFTGDTSTGKKIMQLAATNVKNLHLELGGKAPFIVYEDADIDAAVEGAVAGGFLNNGEDCTAATRIFVHKRVHDIFVKKLVGKTRTLRVGNQLDPKTDVGPLVSEKHLNKVRSYIDAGIREGAKLLYGGRRKFSRGFFIEPAIFVGAKNSMKICQEEVFGPVLCVMKFSTEKEVIKDANDVIYGLAASVWTKDMLKALRTAKALKFGTVWVNEHGILASEMPHGGFKQSGFGKDLSQYAFDEFTQIKHVYIDTTGAKRKPWYYTVSGKK